MEKPSFLNSRKELESLHRSETGPTGRNIAWYRLVARCYQERRQSVARAGCTQLRDRTNDERIQKRRMFAVYFYPDHLSIQTSLQSEQQLSLERARILSQE